MTRVLHIIASPRGAASHSTALAEAYLDRVGAHDPDVQIDVLDLWHADLPEFDGDKAAAKMTFFGEGEMDGARRTAWDEVVAIAARFTAADEIVLSVPMWNGGVPYKLKQNIDIISQPGLLFGFDPEAGYFGLLEGKRARVFYTSGVYAPGAPPKYGTDFHESYLSWWLDFIGIKEVRAERFQPSLLTGTPQADRAAAIERSRGLSLARGVALAG